MNQYSCSRLWILVVLCGMLIIVSSCAYTGEMVEVKATTNDGKISYAISFPDYMQLEEEKRFNADASLQYCSFYRNIYAVVIDETRMAANKGITQYIEKELIALEGVLKTSLRIDSTQVDIGGRGAIQMQLTGKVGEGETEKRIYYRLVFLEAREHIFQLVLWGWDERRSSYINDFDKIVNSFRLLDE